MKTREVTIMIALYFELVSNDPGITLRGIYLSIFWVSPKVVRVDQRYKVDR